MITIKKYSIAALFIAIAVYATVVFAGAPLKGVEVRLQKAIAAGDSRSSGPVAKVTTDHQGKFTFTNLEEGTYEIYCSYDECARAINTKGTGATIRSKSMEFIVTLLSNDNDVAFAAGPRQTTSQDGSYSHGTGGNARVTATQNSQSLRAAITSESSPKTPLATVTISGKKHEFTGHVTLMK